MKLYAGLDLHSNNNVIVIVNESDQVVFRRRQANVASVILQSLEPFQTELAGVVVESTYNWYWLVDALMKAGYRVRLANTAAIRQYEGIKRTNDWTDAQWLAHLLRLGILPEGYIYPAEQRPVRDLLRKRRQLVGERTRHILSVENLLTRNTGSRLSCRKIKELGCEEVERMFPRLELSMAIHASVRVMSTLEEEIGRIEKQVKSRVKLEAAWRPLLSVWGIGETLALTIMLETGPISRFREVGDYSSYCRAVDSRQDSNGKKKGENNAKCGNRYLAWAYVEAANFAARYYPQAQAFVGRKTAEVNRTLGIKALANKLCRASYWVLKDQVEFEPKRLFGS
jgi:transposase